MVYTVTLMNPLASGHDGSWHLDLLMEAVVGEVQVPSPSRQNGNPAPPDDAGRIPSGGSGSGGGGDALGGCENNGEASGSAPKENIFSMHLDDVSDDDWELPIEENDGDGEPQHNAEDDGGVVPGGKHEGGALPNDGNIEVADAGITAGRLGPSDGELYGAQPVAKTSVWGKETAEACFASVEGHGTDPPPTVQATRANVGHILSSKILNENEPVASSDRPSKDVASFQTTLPVKEIVNLVGAKVEHQAHGSPIRDVSPPGSPENSSRTASDNFLLPENCQSPVLDKDDSDSSFEDSGGSTESSSDEYIEDGNDGYEVDVPFPPCSILHPKRKTFKHSLCHECYKKYKNDLEKAGARVSDVDSDTGRPNWKRSPTPCRMRKRKAQGEKKRAISARKQESSEKRLRLLRTASKHASFSDGDNKKKREIKAAMPVPVQRVGKLTKTVSDNFPATTKQGKEKAAQPKKRLVKVNGKPVLEESSSKAAILSDASAIRSGDAVVGVKDDRRELDLEGMARAGKPRIIYAPPGKKDTTGIHNNGTFSQATASGSIQPRTKAKTSSIRHRQASVSTPRSRVGSNDLLGSLMGESKMEKASSVDETTTLHQGSRLKVMKGGSVDTLRNRATAVPTAKLKRGVSVDTGHSSRGNWSVADWKALQTGESVELTATSKPEKRRREDSNRHLPKAVKKVKTRDTEHAPSPTSKSGYTQVPHNTGIVQKVSNGKFFLWVNDKLHDGTPYESSEACAREYEKIVRPVRSSQKGPKWNIGDAKTPPHGKMADLTPLSLSSEKSSRMAKKITSAYRNNPISASTPKAKKSPFFSSNEKPPQSILESRRPQVTEALAPPPIVLSYTVSKIDLPMLRRRNSKVQSPIYTPASRIRWSEVQRTFRPADGLHVPGAKYLLPHRSGLKGGRQGRPVPDTRLSCAKTGFLSGYSRYDVENSKTPLPTGEFSKTEAGKRAPSPKIERPLPAIIARTTPPAADSRTQGSTVLLCPGPVSSGLSNPVRSPVTLPGEQAHPVSFQEVQTPATSFEMHSSEVEDEKVSATPSESVSLVVPDPSLGKAVRNVLENKRDCLNTSNTLGKHSESKGAPTVPLRAHLAQVRLTVAATVDHTVSPWVQAAKELGENGEEEQGRELLQSMMMGGNEEDDSMDLCSIDGENDSTAVDQVDSGGARNNSRQGYPDESIEQTVMSIAPRDLSTEGAEREKDGDGAMEDCKNIAVTNVEDLLAELRSSSQARVDHFQADIPLSLGPANSGSWQQPSPPPPLPLPDAPNFDDGAVAEDTLNALSAELPATLVVQSEPLEESSHVDKSRTTQEPILNQSNSWIQPRRISGYSKKNGARAKSTFSNDELPLHDADNSVNTMPCSLDDDVLAQRDSLILEGATVKRVSWHPPNCVAPIIRKPPCSTKSKVQVNPDSIFTPSKTIHQVAWRAPNRIEPIQLVTSEARSFPPDIQPGQDHDVSPEMVKLPAEIAGLSSEGSTDDLTDVSPQDNSFQTCWRQPNRDLSHQPQPQNVQPTSADPAERPAEASNEIARSGQDLVLPGFVKRFHYDTSEVRKEENVIELEQQSQSACSPPRVNDVCPSEENSVTQPLRNNGVSDTTSAENGERSFVELQTPNEQKDSKREDRIGQLENNGVVTAGDGSTPEKPYSGESNRGLSPSVRPGSTSDDSRSRTHDVCRTASSSNKRRERSERNRESSNSGDGSRGSSSSSRPGSASDSSKSRVRERSCDRVRSKISEKRSDGDRRHSRERQGRQPYEENNRYRSRDSPDNSRSSSRKYTSRSLRDHTSCDVSKERRDREYEARYRWWNERHRGDRSSHSHRSYQNDGWHQVYRSSRRERSRSPYR